MADKIIVTNESALAAKYGGDSQKVMAALGALVAADEARGLASIVLRLDSAADLGPLGAKPVTDPTDDRQCKDAVDGIMQAMTPDYLVLVGAPDVVPYVILDNPHHDEDADIPSDLPYACEAPYSKTAADFLEPSRVVGRLPCVRGATDPEPLLTAIDAAAKWKSRPEKHYRDYFALTAATFTGSTTGSCDAIFSDTSKLEISPSAGPEWNDNLLGRLSHYINCHGAPNYPNWHGQRNHDYPMAQAANWVAGKIAEGCVCVAESCYGAMLYDPKDSKHPTDSSLANRYMGSRAYALWGSTDTTFAPSTNNAGADLICQRFMKNLLAGASTGRAALQARVDYVAHHATHGPTDVKTIAQFVLLGDPSVHPVAPPPVNAAPGARTARRSLLAADSRTAVGRINVAHAGGGAAPHPTVAADIRARLTAMGGTTTPDIRSHAVSGYSASGPSVVHVAISERGISPLGRTNLAVVVVHEDNGKVHRVDELLSH